MKLIEKILPPTHNIYLISDTHEGTILKHRKGLQKVIKKIANDPIGYVAHLGDLIEGITVDDKRYCMMTVDTETSTPIRQYKAVIEELEPIKDKLLVILEGNHDAKIAGRYGDILRDMVCPQLSGNKDSGELYGTYSCKVAIKDREGKLLYKMFLTHGSGSVNSTADDPLRREANMLLALKRKMSPMAGDCIIQAMGHTHRLLVKPPMSELFLTDDGEDVMQEYTQVHQADKFIPKDLRWYINTGCFYKLYHMGVSGYAERAGYAPNELGYIKIRVKGGIIQGVDREVV